MKPLTEKILRSGIIDRHTAEYMERLGMLPEGASEQVREDALRGATVAQLTKLADELTDEVVKANVMRETVLDLERLRWPVSVNIRFYKKDAGKTLQVSIRECITGVIDRQGRYYFRFQDVDQKWFVPGYVLEKVSTTKLGSIRKETILESQVLYVDEQPVCIQVSTQSEE
jgi:hypothetical protein